MEDRRGQFLSGPVLFIVEDWVSVAVLILCINRAACVQERIVQKLRQFKCTPMEGHCWQRHWNVGPWWPSKPSESTYEIRLHFWIYSTSGCISIWMSSEFQTKFEMLQVGIRVCSEKKTKRIKKTKRYFPKINTLRSRENKVNYLVGKTEEKNCLNAWPFRASIVSCIFLMIFLGFTGSVAPLILYVPSFFAGIQLYLLMGRPLF